MNLIQQIESQQMKKDLPDIRVGDTVKVYIRIVEGEKERTQMIEGIVIRMGGVGIRKNVTVRKISFGVGVERIFPIHSPGVEKVEVVKHGRVRRAKLYYMRKLKGKAARLKEVKTPSAAQVAANKAGKVKAEKTA
ncbi:MAG: 50S ribosomal protein L19 [Nitrospinae bacterium]|nr:50S ribosomal protein L19 [Nitrospinota bacterium]